MKSLIILLLFISCTIIPQVEKSEGSKHIQKFDPERDPGQDLNAAIKMAQVLNKRILLDVGGEWCIWCHRLDKFFVDNIDINEYLNEKFIVVKVNYSPENKNEKFLSNYPKVAGYPHLFVLDESGKFLHSQNTGDLEEGKGHDRKKVMAFLKKWASKSVSNQKQEARKQ